MIVIEIVVIVVIIVMVVSCLLVQITVAKWP